MYIRFEELPKWAQKILWETHFFKPNKIKLVVSEQVKIGNNEIKSINQFLYGFNGKKIRKIKSATYESYSKAPDISRALFHGVRLNLKENNSVLQYEENGKKREAIIYLHPKNVQMIEQTKTKNEKTLNKIDKNKILTLLSHQYIQENRFENLNKISQMKKIDYYNNVQNAISEGLLDETGSLTKSGVEMIVEYDSIDQFIDYVKLLEGDDSAVEMVKKKL